MLVRQDDRTVCGYAASINYVHKMNEGMGAPGYLKGVPMPGGAS